jgi:hypothetical protein
VSAEYENINFEKMRKTLLDQSHSQTITHSGFIIAVIIGFFGLIANWINFFGRVKYQFCSFMQLSA